MLPDSRPVLGAEWTARVHAQPRRAAIIAALALLVGIAGAAGVARYQKADVMAQATQRLLQITGPENVKPDEAVSVTVTIKANNVPDATYTGTVHFSSKDDSGALLPADYTFTAADAGTHNFDKAVTFRQAGTRTLTVSDAADGTLSNELPFTVAADAGGTGGTGATGTKPVITDPVSGATINQTSTTIRGTASPAAAVTVTDNSAPAGSAVAGVDGTFSLEVQNLVANSTHTFVASAGELASDPVTITVQTAGALRPPELVLSQETVTIDPSQQAPKIDAQVIADAGLRSVRLQLDQRTVDLQEALDSPGTYKGSFLAPVTAGSFPVDVLVENALGTQQTYSALKVLSVTVSVATQPPLTNAAPTASFTFEPTSGKVPLTVTFTSSAFDQEDGASVSYLWDFGDGSTSTEANPTHVYRIDGPYTPQLTVTDSGGMQASAQASTAITATGPAGLVVLLLVSALVALLLSRRTRTA